MWNTFNCRRKDFVIQFVGDTWVIYAVIRGYMHIWQKKKIKDFYLTLDQGSSCVQSNTFKLPKFMFKMYALVKIACYLQM